VAGAEALAGDGFEVLTEAGLDSGEMVAATAKQNAALRKVWIGCGKEVEDGVRCHADLLIDVLELGWDLEGVEGLVFHGEEASRADSRAGAVLGPLMFEERQVGRDVEVLCEVCGGGLFATEDGVGAVVVLCPETVQDEAGMRGALG